MFIGGLTAVLIGQGSLNDLPNTNYIELIVAPFLLFSLTSESITSIALIKSSHQARMYREHLTVFNCKYVHLHSVYCLISELMGNFLCSIT